MWTGECLNSICRVKTGGRPGELHGSHHGGSPGIPLVKQSAVQLLDEPHHAFGGPAEAEARHIDDT